MARPSLRSFVKNFSAYEGSPSTKARLALRNTLKKVTTFSSCCGHPGEPGC
jgi:hypothetical protein